MKDLNADLHFVIEKLNSKSCRECERVHCDVVKILERHLRAVPSTGGEVCLIESCFTLWPDVQLVLDDAITDVALISEQLEEIIEGRRDGPILTPMKKKRKCSDENGDSSTIIEDTTTIARPEATFVKPTTPHVQKTNTVKANALR